jgi:hypothetical protein
MSGATFEPAVPAIKRQQIYALDFMTNGIGFSAYSPSFFYCILTFYFESELSYFAVIDSKL